MNLHTWWFYVATVFVVSGIPGPNMLLVMAHSAQYGPRRAGATMAGCWVSLILMLSISAAGLGVFLKAWPAMFNMLKLLGAAYLIYLGVKAWRAAGQTQTHPTASSPSPSSVEHERALKTPRLRLLSTLFRTGFFVASSNPKAILFAAALLPQFINTAAATLPQFGILIATFSVIEISWYFSYAALGSRIGAVLKSPSVKKVFDRLMGGVFVGLGAMMVWVRN